MWAGRRCPTSFSPRGACGALAGTHDRRFPVMHDCAFAGGAAGAQNRVIPGNPDKNCRLCVQRGRTGHAQPRITGTLRLCVPAGQPMARVAVWQAASPSNVGRSHVIGGSKLRRELGLGPRQSSRHRGSGGDGSLVLLVERLENGSASPFFSPGGLKLPVRPRSNRLMG